MTQVGGSTTYEAGDYPPKTAAGPSEASHRNRKDPFTDPPDPPEDAEPSNEAGKKPRISLPKTALTIDQRALIFETLLSESNDNLSASLRDQMRIQGTSNKARIEAMAKIRYQQLANQVAQEASRSRSWIFKIYKSASRALTAIPCVGPALGSVAKTVMCIGPRPSVSDLGLTLIVLASSLKPFAELGLLSEGKDRGLKDVVGGPPWVSALLTFDLGALMSMGVAEMTDDDAAITAVSVIGEFLTMAIAASASSQVGGGGSEDSGDVSNILKLASIFTTCVSAAGTIGEGNETLQHADLNKRRSETEAALIEFQALETEHTKLVEFRLNLYVETGNFSKNIFGFTADVGRIYNRGLAAPFGGIDEGRSHAMA